MKTWLIILAYFLLALGASPTAMAQLSHATPSEEEELNVPKARKFIYLTLGIEYDEKVLSLPEVITFHGDFKKVTSAVYSKSNQSIRFSPKGEGIATLEIMDKNGKKISEYRLIVRKSKLDAVAREIQSLLGDIEGITVKILNGKVIVDGQVLLASDLVRVVTVVDQFKDSSAASLVTMSPLALRKIADYIARDINNPEIEVRALNDKMILSGWANSDDEKVGAEKIASFYMPPVMADQPPADKLFSKKTIPGIVNLIKVKPAQPQPPAKMVQVVVHYVELAKDYQKSFRFQFMPDVDDGSGITFQSGDAATGGGSQFTATIKSLFPKLNWLKSHGHARALASGTILVKEGEKGTFSSQSSSGAATKVSGPAGAQTPSSGPPIGISTSITPTLTGERSDSVDLDIHFQIGAPSGVSADGPTVSTNTIDSKLVVRSTQSAAIGGLITNTTFTGYNRLPAGVSNNPIISLYASKEFSRGQSQFVVFVTPIIRSSASVGAEKLKKKFRLRE